MTHQALDDARRELGWSHLNLWIEYFALGGNLDADQLASYLRGQRQITNTDHNTIAHALNERFLDLNQNHPLNYRFG